VLDKQKDISENIEKLLLYSEQKEEPEIQVGNHCSKPYTCAYWEYCHNEDGDEVNMQGNFSLENMLIKSK